MRSLRVLLVALIVCNALPAYAQQWDQVNGSMQVRSGPTAPLVIIDQTASGQKIISLRANGTEVCYATATAFTCTGGFTFPTSCTGTYTGPFTNGVTSTGQCVNGSAIVTTTSTAVTSTVPYVKGGFTFTDSGSNGLLSLDGDNTILFRTNTVTRAELSSLGLTSTVPGLWPDGTAANPSMAFSGEVGLGWLRQGTNTINATSGGVPFIKTWPGGFSLTSGMALGWSSTTDATVAPDVSLSRLAADTLGLRRGTATQEFDIGPSGSTLYFTKSNGGNGTIGTQDATALLFAPGGTTKWYIDSSGNMFANGAYNIGDGAGNSPVNIYAEGGYYLASLAASATAPSGPVACTTPTVTWSNGTAAFQIDVGGTCAAVNTLVVTLPAATNAWSCNATNVTTSATAKVEMTASTSTSATFTNYTRTTGIALAWVDGADVRISCLGG